LRVTNDLQKKELEKLGDELGEKDELEELLTEANEQIEELNVQIEREEEKCLLLQRIFLFLNGLETKCILLTERINLLMNENNQLKETLRRVRDEYDEVPSPHLMDEQASVMSENLVARKHIGSFFRSIP
jgi:chromosome segregation ATPase